VKIPKITGALLPFLILIFNPGSLESKETTMTKQAIQTIHAPEAIGPYSQAIRVDHFLFLSGQIGINPETKKVVEGGVEPQTHQIVKYIKAILAKAGSDINRVVKVTVFLKDMSNFKLVNSIYAQNFSEPYPARSAVAVKELPLAVDIEIEAVAVI